MDDNRVALFGSVKLSVRYSVWAHSIPVQYWHNLPLVLVLCLEESVVRKVIPS